MPIHLNIAYSYFQAVAAGLYSFISDSMACNTWNNYCTPLFGKSLQTLEFECLVFLFIKSGSAKIQMILLQIG